MKLFLAIAVFGLTACATAQASLQPTEVADFERSLRGEQRFLRVSMYQTPFFGDSTRRLLTPLAPELVRFLQDPQGKPISPGAVERTFPVGTRVRIAKVEYPTSWTMTERVLYTPRTLIWIYLDVADSARQAPPAVLVLRPGISSSAELRAEIDRHLTREDPAPRLETFSEAVRDAIRSKTAIVEMPAEALEMAWGFPEAKKIELVGSQRRETWRWGDGTRTAVLLDGRVAQLSGASGASSSSP